MKFIIKPHSTIDVITNSSSELFICNTDKSAEFVTEVLKEFLSSINKITGFDRSFERCFNPVHKLETENDVRAYLEEMVWWENDYPRIYSYDKNITPEERDKRYKEEEIAAKEFEDKWIADEVENNLNKYLGSIVIESASDNSIPFELFDVIEYGFSAKRYHLG